MEGDIIFLFLGNEREPQLFGKMEDDLNFKENGRRPQLSGKRKKKPQCLFKWKTILVLAILAWQAQPQLVFTFFIFIF